MQIPREIFKAAIESGIAHADLDPDEEERLLVVGQTAKTVGDNYDNGCPASQAGLYCGDPRVTSFAVAYDRHLMYETGWNGREFSDAEII